MKARVTDFVVAFNERGLLTYASAIAFQVISALAPALLFVLGLLGFLHLQDVYTSDIAPHLRDHLSPAALSIVTDTVGARSGARPGEPPDDRMGEPRVAAGHRRLDRDVARLRRLPSRDRRLRLGVRQPRHLRRPDRLPLPVLHRVPGRSAGRCHDPRRGGRKGLPWLRAGGAKPGGCSGCDEPRAAGGVRRSAILVVRFAPATGGAQPSHQRVGDLDGIYPVLTGSDPAPQLGDVGGAIPARLV